MKPVKITLECSKSTSTAVRAELGMQSLRTGRDVLHLAYKYRGGMMGDEKLPKIRDRVDKYISCGTYGKDWASLKVRLRE